MNKIRKHLFVEGGFSSFRCIKYDKAIVRGAATILNSETATLNPDIDNISELLKKVPQIVFGG